MALYEFRASLVYVVSSSPARATKQESDIKKKKKSIYLPNVPIHNRLISSMVILIVDWLWVIKMVI